jgi:hypothetical protein
MKSPAKKQLLVSMSNNQNGNRGNNKSADIYHVVGKSVENIYEKVIYFLLADNFSCETNVILLFLRI